MVLPKLFKINIRQKVKHLLWELNPNDLSWLQRISLRQVQTAALVIRDFGVNQCMLRAAALAYYTMLSLVPLLALVFALLKAFGVQNLLQPLILDKLNVGDGETAEMILGYIDNTQVTQLGAVGLVFLLIAVISLLTNIEKTFNSIWGVAEVRPLIRRVTDYLSVIIIGPIFVIGAISMTSSMASHTLVQALIEKEMIGTIYLWLFKVAPFVFMWLAFTVLYVFMSNIKVEWRAAFIGGVVGGSLWQIAQVGYVYFQVGVARHNAIYGTMAALPIFMVWLYLSWVIVLFGLGVCYAKQNLRTSGRDIRGSEVSRNSFEQVALALLVTLADRFSLGEPPLSNEKIASLLFVPPRLCRSVIGLLISVGYVTEIRSISGHCKYQLGRSAQNLSVSEILKTMADAGEEALHLHPHPQTLVALSTCSQIETLVEDSLVGKTLSDLVEQSQQQGVVDKQKIKG